MSGSADSVRRRGPVLITGGAGFVGANLVRRLAAEGCDVHLLLNQNIDTWRISALPGWVRHDVELVDRSEVRDLLHELRPKVIFHLATHGAYSWQHDEDLILATNVIGTRNLLRAASETGVDAFVATGSSSEYGFADRATHEDDRVEPNSVYALTKAAATMYCRLVAAETGMWTPTLRLYSVYGPWEDPGRLFPSLLRSAEQGRLPPLASPDTARDFVYVDDVIDALCRVTDSGREVVSRTGDCARIFNIGSGRMTTLRSLVGIVMQEFGLVDEPEWNSMPDRKWDARIWLSDPSRSWSELGWRASVDLRSGIRRMRGWIAQTEGVTLK